MQFHFPLILFLFIYVSVTIVFFYYLVVFVSPFVYSCKFGWLVGCVCTSNELFVFGVQNASLFNLLYRFGDGNGYVLGNRNSHPKLLVC